MGGLFFLAAQQFSCSLKTGIFSSVPLVRGKIELWVLQDPLYWVAVNVFEFQNPRWHGPCECWGQPDELTGGWTRSLRFSGNTAQTPCCSLPHWKSGFFFLLKSETYWIIYNLLKRFYWSRFHLFRKSENLLNMLATRERERGNKTSNSTAKNSLGCFCLDFQNTAA